MDDPQLTEVLGRHHLIDELVRAGLEVAEPVRDRGIDLLAYADRDQAKGKFSARPIQMKAASQQSFGLDRKYAEFPDLLLAYVWNLDTRDRIMTFAMTYQEALGILEAMGYADTASWKDHGAYVNTRPGVRLRELLEPFRMTPKKWWDLITS